MEFKKLIDRTKETDRIKSALHRDSTQFIVVYGRRRKGEIPIFHKERSGSVSCTVLEGTAKLYDRECQNCAA